MENNKQMPTMTPALKNIIERLFFGKKPAAAQPEKKADAGQEKATYAEMIKQEQGQDTKAQPAKKQQAAAPAQATYADMIKNKEV